MADFDFVPPTGLLDTSVYPDVPASPTAARQQFMDLFYQARDVIRTNANQIGNLSHYIRPTGTADDTSFLNSTINTYPVVVLKAGTYYVDPTVNGSNFGWTIPSNRTIIFEPGAILQSKTNSADDYRVMFLNGVSNVTLYNPVVYGDKSTHTGSTGEGGHCIGIYSSSNINIFNPTCNNGWGVGIGIVNVDNCYIENALCDNNRQNGIAIIGGKDVTLVKPKCTNTNGTAPSGGIDIEPNDGSDYLKNINLINPVTEGNAGAGIFVALALLVNSTNNVQINITDHVDRGSEYGLYLGKLAKGTSGILTGRVVIENPYYENNNQNGIYINNYASENTPSIMINRPKIINPNAHNGGTRPGVGIILLREVAATETNKLGNISIVQPDIRDIRTTNLMTFGIHAEDEKGSTLDRFFIIDPIAIDGTATADINYKIWMNKSGAKITDRNNVCSTSFSSDRILADRVYTKLDNTGAAAIVNFTLPTSGVLIDAPTTFNVLDADGIKLTPAAGMNILPISTVNGKYIQSTQQGASITIRKLSSTSWIIENMIGTWTVQP